MTSEKSYKIENPIMRLMAILYIVIGIVQIGYFAIASSTAPPHLPVLGILSLITAFSLFQMYKWTLPLALVTFVTGITFAATTLSNSLALQEFGDAILINLALVVYVIALLITSLYVFTKRADLS